MRCSVSMVSLLISVFCAAIWLLSESTKVWNIEV